LTRGRLFDTLLDMKAFICGLIGGCVGLFSLIHELCHALVFTLAGKKVVVTSWHSMSVYGFSTVGPFVGILGAVAGYYGCFLILYFVAMYLLKNRKYKTALFIAGTMHVDVISGCFSDDFLNEVRGWTDVQGMTINIIVWLCLTGICLIVFWASYVALREFDKRALFKIGI